MLVEVLADGRGDEGYRWLSRQPFAEPIGSGIMLHASIADALRWVIAAVPGSTGTFACVWRRTRTARRSRPGRASPSTCR